MEIVYFIIKILHIIAGTAALLAGLLAIIFRKKVKVHKPFGKVYFLAMTFIFFSAVYMASWRSNLFFFFLSFFSYYSCLVAYRALRLKRLHAEQIPMWYDWGIEIFFGLMHLAFIIVGVIFLQTNLSFGIISCVFGLIGLRGNYDNINRLRKKLTFKNYWLLAHIGGMLGSYMGAITAFLVNNNKWIHLPDLVAWLAPTVLLLPLLLYEVREHKRKAGKFAEKISTNN